MSTRALLLEKRSQSPTPMEQGPAFSDSERIKRGSLAIVERIGANRESARQNIRLQPPEVSEKRKSSPPVLRKGAPAESDRPRTRPKATGCRTEAAKQFPLMGKDSQERASSPLTSPRRQHLSVNLRSKSTNLKSPGSPELQKLNSTPSKIGEKRVPNGDSGEQPKAGIRMRVRPGARPLNSGGSPYKFRNSRLSDASRSPRQVAQSATEAPEQLRSNSMPPSSRQQPQTPQQLTYSKKPATVLQMINIVRATEDIESYLEAVRRGGAKAPPQNSQD
jgi:hypothetical protein